MNPVPRTSAPLGCRHVRPIKTRRTRGRLRSANVMSQGDPPAFGEGMGHIPEANNRHHAIGLFHMIFWVELLAGELNTIEREAR